VDLDAAVRDKLADNARRYPVEAARGHNRKSPLRRTGRTGKPGAALTFPWRLGSAIVALIAIL